LQRFSAGTGEPRAPGAAAAAGAAGADETSAAAADLQSLSLFRIGFALYLLGDFALNVWRFFAAFYGADGIMPLDALAVAPRGGGAHMPVLRALEAIGFAGIVPVVYPLALVAFAIGYRTRWATLACFALNAFLYWRNPILVSGAEALARMLLLWSLFLPLNRYWSVDAALDPAPRERACPSLPFFAIRLQIASLYLFSALFKFAGQPWRDGIAIGQALSDNIFGAPPASQLLVDHAAGLLAPLSFAVIGFQIAFPFLVYCPWRNDLVRAAALTAAALMHVSFIVALNVGGFPYICLAMLLLLVPDRWVTRALARRRARLGRIVIYYDPDCGFCRRVSLLLREVALTSRTRVLPASADPEAMRVLTAHQSWIVDGADGVRYLKWPAVAYVLRQNPVLAPLGWLSDRAALRPAMARLYDRIGAARHRLGPLAARLLPFRSDRPIGTPLLALCGGLMVLGFASNVASVVSLSVTLPELFNQVVNTAQVGQSWELFAPRPTHWRRTFRLEVATADGATADLDAWLPVPLFRIDDGAVSFASHRWLKFFTQLDDLPEAQRAAFGAWLCREAARHARGAAVRAVVVHETKLLIEPGPEQSWVFDYRFACAP
jgi:hypothetical protein